MGKRSIFIKIKNAHSSISVESRTHVDRRFSYHKDLRYYLLLLCLHLMANPVYTCNANM